MIIVTADLHLNDLPRDTYRHDWMANILPTLLKKHKAELLLILGDICDSKDHHGAWLVNQIVDELQDLSKICPILISMGNHDYITASHPFFEFLGKIENITWISAPCDTFQVGGPLGHALMLPHTVNYKRDWKHLDIKKYDLILAHQTFQGAKVGPRKMDGIPTHIFAKDALVLSGDIHEPQEFDQIVYCGSPFSVDFGDNFDPRVLLLDPVALTVKSIPSPGPQKRLIEVDSVAELKQQRMCHKGDILKVRVHLDAADHAQWPAIQDQVKAWGAKEGFTIYLVQPIVEGKGVSGSAKVRKANTRTDEQLLDIYAKSRAVGEATVKTGLNLLRKV